MSLPHTALALFAVLIWGFNFVVMRWGLDDLPPIFFCFLRYLAAALPLALFIPKPNVAWRWIIAFGVFQFGLQFTLLFVGINLGMPAGLSSLVMQLQVFFTMSLAVLWLGERATPLQIIGAIVAASGMVLVATQIQNNATLLGFCFVVGGAFCWGVANIISKRMPKTDALAFVVWASVVACPMLLAASFVFEGSASIATAVTKLNLKLWAIIAFNGWAAAIMGFGLWSYLMRIYPATTVAPYSLLVPIVGMGSAVIFLHEPVLWWKLAAGALVLTGVALNQWASKQTAAKQKQS